MSTNPAQPKPFSLIVLCVVFVLSLAALAAGVRPAVPAGEAAPLPQAVPLAPAPAAAALTAAAQPNEALAVLPQPVPVPVAPGTDAIARDHIAYGNSVTGLPAAGGPLAALVLVVVSAVLLAGVLRRAGPTPRAAAC